MDHLSAIVFPHAYLGEENTKRILSLFERLTLFIPWYAGAPPFTHATHAIEVAAPPESLKPSDDFPRLLAEYKLWMQQHADKGLLGFLKASRGLESAEETTWEIRRSLKEVAMERPQGELEALTLKWHMVLHLAGEVEKQRVEADRVLQELKERKSPLEGVLDEESELRSLFEDLPGFSEGASAEDEQVAAILQAWLGLFGENLGPKGFLVTVNQAVMGVLSELWEGDRGFQGSLSENIISFRWPDLSSLDFGEISRARHDMLEDDRLNRIHALLTRVDEDPRGVLRKLREEAHRLTLDKYPRVFQATVRYLDPDSVERGPQETGKFKSLAGKVLVLIRG